MASEKPGEASNSQNANSESSNHCKKKRSQDMRPFFFENIILWNHHHFSMRIGKTFNYSIKLIWIKNFERDKDSYLFL